MDAFASLAQLVPGKKYFTHKLGLDSIMLRIYGQKPLFGAFVRKTGSETSEFLRTNGYF